MNIENDVNKRRPLRRPPTSPDDFGRHHPEKKLQPYPFRESHTHAALAHCELSTTPGDERLDCPLKALARHLINAEGEWIADMREDEGATVQAMFGLQIEWQAAKGARWTGFWTIPLPGGREIQEEVKAFEQFLAGRPEPKAVKTPADSIRRVAALVSGYIADITAHAARPVPWNEPEHESRPARDHDVETHP